jgi:hypothetical protein
MCAVWPIFVHTAILVVNRLIVGLDGAYAPPDMPLPDNAELTTVTPKVAEEGR